MILKQTIEQFDPGHFDRRKDILEDLREKVRELGFFPLPLTQNDIDCFWVRLEPNDSHKGLHIHFTKDDLFWLENENTFQIYKDVARYET